MTITGFLNGRLDEVEAAAKAANGLSWLETDGDEPGDSWIINEHMHLFETDTATAVHIARHDPARVLREVAAGRAILAAYVQARKEYDAGEPGLALHVLVRELGECVKEMASVHSDHADYDPAWQPG